MAYYKSWIDRRNNYMRQNGLGDIPWQTAMGSGGVDAAPSYSTEEIAQIDAAQAAYDEKFKQLNEAFLGTLSPADKQAYAESMYKNDQSMNRTNKIGKGLAMGIIGGAGLGAAGVASGLLGGGSTVAESLAGGSLFGGGGAGTGAGLLEGAEAGLGYGGYGGAGGTIAENAGAAAQLGGYAEGGQIAADAASAGAPGANVGSIAAGSAGPAASIPSGSGSALSNLLKTGASNLQDLLPSNIGGAASDIAGLAGLANSLRKPETPTPVDFPKLAQDQANFDKQAMDDSLKANRTNQTNAQGDNQSWTQNPDGTWSQKQTFGESNQKLFDQAQSLKSGLLGQAASAGPLTTEGLPDVGQPLMSARGNNQDIQNAWMSRLAPERDRQRQNEYARLAGIGLTEGTPGFANAMRQLNEGDTDAQNQALIYGTQEYGNEYNRDIQGRQSQQNARTSMFNQRQTIADQPYRNLNSVAGATPGNPIFGAQVNRGTPTSTQAYQAGKDAYGQDVANTNVANVQRGNMTEGLYGLANVINKGGWGKP